MRVIIAGSRDITDLPLVDAAVARSGFVVSLVVSGGARGVDTLGERWAVQNNIPFKRYPADWELYGKQAGPCRNIEMAENGEGLIAIWNGRSKGTGDMIAQARRRGLAIYIHLVGQDDGPLFRQSRG